MKMTILAALLLLSAHAAAPDSTPLTGSVWTLTQLAPRGQALTPGEGLRRPTLKIMPGGMLTGTTGCKGFSGWATVKGEAMKVTPLKLSGPSNCSDHALSLESDFVNVLDSATRFEISGQQLTVYGAGNRFVTFKASEGEKGERSVTGNRPQLSTMKGQWRLTTLLHSGQHRGQHSGQHRGQHSGQPVKVPSDSFLTVQDVDGGVEVRGRAGCNTMFGKVTLKGRTLSVSDLGMTMMLCEDMASENAVVDILRVPLTVTQNGETMMWRNSRGELTLTRVKKDESDMQDFNARDLGGRTFTLRTVAGRPVARTVKPVSVTFGAGTVSGSDGCNTFTGRAEWHGNQLTAGPLASTRMFCEGMDQVARVNDLLGLQPTAELLGDTLRLTANGVVWVFTARP